MDQLQQNYLRIVAVIYGPGLNAVRCYFDRCFPPSLLNTQLSSVLRTKLKSLKEKKVLSNAQWGILFPANANTSSSMFDVGLMTLLLRHFHIKKDPKYGYDVLPPDKDHTPAADLARIKYYRNFVAHSKDGIFDGEDYKEAWRLLNDVVNRLGDAVLKQECELLGRADLNMAYKAQCEELSRNILTLTEKGAALESGQDQLASDMKKQEKISRQNEILIKQILEDISINEATQLVLEGRINNLNVQLDRMSERLNSRKEIVQKVKTWIKDEKQYVIIDASVDALDMFKTSPILTVAGSVGSGKTALIRHLALRFMTQGYEIVPVRKPKSIVKYHDQTKKQVFVLDDAFGKHHVDQKKCTDWLEISQVIRDCLLESGALLLVSVRLTIFNSELFKCMKVLSLNVINLKDKKYELSFKNRQDIFQSYLKRGHEEFGITDKSLLMHDAFPFLCSYLSGQFSTVSNDQNVTFIKQKSDIDLNNLESFFHSPISVIEKEIQKIKNNSPVSYCALALCFLFNGKLPKPDLFFSNSHKSLLEDCYSVCGLNRGTPVKDLSDIAKSLTDVYLKEIDGSFIFIHDIMMDIVSVSFGEHFPDIILKYAETEVIINRLQLEKNSTETPGYKIYIPEKHHTLFFHRLCTEIERGNAWQVFDHCQLDIKWVQKEMTSYLETLSDNKLSHLFFQVEDKELQGGRHLKLRLKFLDLWAEFKDSKPVTIESNEFLHLIVCNAFHWILGKGHLEMLMLLERRVYSHVYNELSRSNNACTYITILGGNIETYSWILNVQQGRRLWQNISNKWFQNKYLMQDFQWAVLTGRTEFVEFLLKKEICQTCINNSETITTLNIEEKLYGSSFYREKVKLYFIHFLSKICCKLNVKMEDFEYNPRNLMFCIETAFKDCLSEKLLMKKLRFVIKPLIEKLFKQSLKYQCSEFPLPKTIFDFALGTKDARHTYLSLAALYGHESVVNLLLLKGANPNKISIPSNIHAKRHTSYAIVHAAMHGRLTIVKNLLQHGAKIESTGPMGCTLLMLASSYGHFDLVKFLLDEHVDINATNIFKNTALTYASDKGHTNIVRLLRNHGAITNNICHRSPRYCIGSNIFMRQFRFDDSSYDNDFVCDHVKARLSKPNEIYNKRRTTLNIQSYKRSRRKKQKSLTLNKKLNAKGTNLYLQNNQLLPSLSLKTKSGVLGLMFLFFLIGIIIVKFL